MITLHKTSILSRAYWVDDWPLVIYRARSGWRLLVVEDHEPKVVEWIERNQALLRTSFPTRREARECVEALVSLSPPPTQVERLATSCLKRVRPGQYEVQLPGGERLQVNRRDGWWQIEVPNPTSLPAFVTEADLRFSSLRELRRHHQTLSFVGAILCSQSGTGGETGS